MGFFTCPASLLLACKSIRYLRHYCCNHIFGNTNCSCVCVCVALVQAFAFQKDVANDFTIWMCNWYIPTEEDLRIKSSKDFNNHPGQTFSLLKHDNAPGITAS